MGILEDEEVSLSDYADFHDIYNQIGRFIDDVYCHPHRTGVFMACLFTKDSAPRAADLGR